MSMAAAQVSSSLCLCGGGTRRISACAIAPVLRPLSTRLASSFVTASPLRLLPSSAAAGVNRTSVSKRNGKPFSIRSQQSSKEGSSLDVWLGRVAMVGFAVAITIEITTGKGLLENFGLTSPLPTVALAVTALVGVLTAVFIFQSASKN